MLKQKNNSREEEESKVHQLEISSAGDGGAYSDSSDEDGERKKAKAFAASGD